MNLRFLRLNQGGAAGGGAGAPATPPANGAANDAPPAWATGLLNTVSSLQAEIKALKSAGATPPATPPAGGAAGGQGGSAADDIQQMRATLERQNQRIASQAIDSVVNGGLASAGIPADRLPLAAPALYAAAKLEYDHNTGAVTGLNAQGLRVPAADVVKGWAATTGKFFLPPVQTPGTGINAGGGNAGAGGQRTTFAEYSPKELCEIQEKQPELYRQLRENSFNACK